MHHEFVMVTWLKCPNISINDKNLQNIGLKGNID